MLPLPVVVWGNKTGRGRALKKSSAASVADGEKSRKLSFVLKIDVSLQILAELRSVLPLHPPDLSNEFSMYDFRRHFDIAVAASLKRLAGEKIFENIFLSTRVYYNNIIYMGPPVAIWYPLEGTL